MVDVHDFPGDAIGKAIPYGVYDMAANDGFVSVGVDHDPPVFAVSSIKAWGKQVAPPNGPRMIESYCAGRSLLLRRAGSSLGSSP